MTHKKEKKKFLNLKFIFFIHNIDSRKIPKLVDKK
jgi:hypothetical protein